jgi:gliding motility-associated-like protein
MHKLILTFLAICLAYAAAVAQPYVSRLGRFEVDQISGCAPLTVNVTIRPGFTCNGGSPCDMDYEGDFTFESLDFTHTYQQPGTYVLRILFQGLLPAFDDITITVVPNVQPTFQIYSCTGNSSQLAVTDTNYDEYVINYNDGSPEVVVPRGPLARDTHTFATAGGKLVSVKGRNAGSDDNCNARNWTLTAMASLPTPTINQLQVVDATTIRLDFTNVQQNILYKLEIATNTNGFQPFRDVSNSTTQTITGLNTASNYYCFRMGVFDPCSNTLLAYSNIICSADFDATAINSGNRLVWRTSSVGVSNYSFSRNPASTAALSATPPQTTLDDTDVSCNVEYCYQLTTLYANGSRSTSLSQCVTAFTDEAPVATQNISIQVTDATSLDLHWTQDPLYTPAEYTIFKAGVEVGKTTLPTYSDNFFLLNAGACYAISYVDACGNQSATSTAACPINLSAALQPDNSVVLSWNAFNGWSNGVSNYTIERYGSDGQLLGSVDAGTGITFTDAQADANNQVIVYRIVATAVDGGIVESISNEVTITRQPNIYHPNTFTPNSDGLNDTFQVMSQYTNTVEFMVFNRWGEMLFYTTDLSVAWDGTYKGSIVPEGTYVFRAFLTDMSGTKYERSGNVVLLRKR